MHRLWTASLTLLFPIGAADAQSRSDVDSLPQRLAAYMKPYTEMRDFSGRILVAYRGAVVLDSAFTAPEVRPSPPDTRFGIGSVTKTFTAAAICLLAERGKLRLSDSLGTFIPELAAGRKATIEQALGHTAGTRITMGNRTTLVCGRVPSRFESSLDGLARPLGLSSAGQLNAVTGSLAAGLDPAAAPRFLTAATPPDLSWLAGSGSMYSTTGDLLRWVAALRSDQLFRFSKLRYAYGWHAEGDSVLEQNGRVPAGYTTQLTTYPKQDLTVVVLGQVQSDVVGRIKNDITAMIAGRPYRIPAKRAVVVLADSISSRYVVTYEFGPGFRVSVRRRKEGLELAGPEGYFFPLEPVSASRFFFRPVYVAVQFERDSSGRDVLIWNGDARAARVSTGVP